jgi:hypothetical protein
MKEFRCRTIHPFAERWFEDLMSVDDLAERLRSFDEATAFAPDRMEGILASIITDADPVGEVGEDQGYSHDMHIAAAIFWRRATQRHIWPNDRWINRTVTALLQSLEDEKHASKDEEDLLG